jgi:hypothetical protein
MLINKGMFKKEDLLSSFVKYFPEVNLPKNSASIILSELKKEDIEDVLKFSLNCLSHLIK